MRHHAVSITDSGSCRSPMIYLRTPYMETYTSLPETGASSRRSTSDDSSLQSDDGSGRGGSRCGDAPLRLHRGGAEGRRVRKSTRAGFGRSGALHKLLHVGTRSRLSPDRIWAWR